MPTPSPVLFLPSTRPTHNPLQQLLSHSIYSLDANLKTNGQASRKGLASIRSCRAKPFVTVSVNCVLTCYRCCHVYFNCNSKYMCTAVDSRNVYFISSFLQVITKQMSHGSTSSDCLHDVNCEYFSTARATALLLAFANLGHIDWGNASRDYFPFSVSRRSIWGGGGLGNSVSAPMSLSPAL